MNTTKIIVTHRYFSAILEGFNGSQSRMIAEVDGCWDTEEEAEAALDDKCDKKRLEWCDSWGVAREDSFDRSDGWLRDYQRTHVTYVVVASLNGQLVHSLRENLNANEEPDWTEEDILAALDGEAGDYEIEFAGDEN